MTTVYGIDGMERHKTPNVSAIREMRASVCLSVCIGRKGYGRKALSVFSKDEENDDDGVTDGWLSSLPVYSSLTSSSALSGRMRRMRWIGMRRGGTP